MSSFRVPFVGHLPGYLTHNERTSPGRPDQDTYQQFLATRWQALLESEDSRDESLIQAFLQRHPSLLPGSHSVDGDSGHPAFPLAVISKPKLPGLSDREPDFMWLATDSASLYPVLIEIATREPLNRRAVLLLLKGHPAGLPTRHPPSAAVISSGEEWQTSQHVCPERPYRLSRDGRYRLGASHRRHLLLLRSCDLWLCIS